MVIVEAYQHVFSTVSKEISPNGKRGYQTLFVSKGISEDLIQEIESRCVFQGKQDEDRKWQYYPLGERWIVVSQSIPLQELDEFGRKGRYLTHSLLLSFSQLDHLGFCALDILNQFPFFSTLDQVFDEAKKANGFLPRLELSVNYEWHKVAINLKDQWLYEPLVKLGRLSWQADRMVSDNEKVITGGNHQAFIELAALMFSLASPKSRLNLSFDSMADGCNWGKQHYFWLQGFQMSDPGPGLHRVDLKTKNVNSSLLSDHDSPFGEWMKENGLKINFATCFDNQFIIESYQSIVFSGQPFKGNAEPLLNSPLKNQFVHQNKRKIVDRWMKLLPLEVDKKMIFVLENQINKNIDFYFTKLVQGASSKDFSDLLFYGLHQMGEVPSKREQKAFSDFISSNQHPGLLAMNALWDEDADEWLKYLEMLNEQQYQYALQALSNWPELPLSIIEALGTKYPRIWMKYAAQKVKPKEWSLVLAFLADNGNHFLNTVADVLPFLDEQSKREVIKWTKKEKTENPILKKFVAENEKDKASIFGRFRKEK